MCRCENLLALEDSDFRGQLVLGPWAGAVRTGRVQTRDELPRTSRIREGRVRNDN